MVGIATWRYLVATGRYVKICILSQNCRPLCNFFWELSQWCGLTRFPKKNFPLEILRSATCYMAYVKRRYISNTKRFSLFHQWVQVTWLFFQVLNKVGLISITVYSLFMIRALFGKIGGKYSCSTWTGNFQLLILSMQPILQPDPWEMYSSWSTIKRVCGHIFFKIYSRKLILLYFCIGTLLQAAIFFQSRRNEVPPDSRYCFHRYTFWTKYCKAAEFFLASH